MKDLEKTVPWVAMPIQMFDYGNPNLFILKEDDDAFNLYFELAKLTQNPWTYGNTATTVAVLSDQIPLVTDKTKNRAKHKHLLKVLADRGYIKISPSDYKNDTLITIEVPNASNTIKKDDEDHEDDECKKFKFNRFVQVKQEDYESCLGNARYFRAWIYAEHRMFRGTEKEGEWIFYNEEWQNVMDIQSKTTIVKLFKEMQSFNIIDKIEGKTYTDKNGNVRTEGSRYIPVSKGVREVRQEQAEGKGTIKTLKKQMNFELDLASDILDDIDPRAENTNLHNSGYLTPSSWYVWQTTKYKVTKERGDIRFGALKEKNPTKYKELEREGKKILETKNKESEARRLAEEYNNIQWSQEEIEFINREINYKKRDTGRVDMSNLLD